MRQWGESRVPVGNDEGRGIGTGCTEQKSERRSQIEPTARGTDLRGLLVSAATRAVFSDPDMAKMQVGMTERKPLKPWVNGSAFQ